MLKIQKLFLADLTYDSHEKEIYEKIKNTIMVFEYNE